jgi:hypothetical protein
MTNAEMSSTEGQAHGIAPLIDRIARRAAGIAAECNYAQRRLTQLRLSLDSYVDDVRQVPGSYQEFMQRTAGALRHEPSAWDREAGRPW